MILLGFSIITQEMEETIMRSNLEEQRLMPIKQVKSGQVNNVIYFLTHTCFHPV